MVDDCVITFRPTRTCVRVITTWRIRLTVLIQESKQPSFNKLRYSPANLEQLESCYERDRSLRFLYTRNHGNCESLSAVVVYVHQRILAHGSHGGRRKSIVVIVSPLEALVLDLAKAITTMGTSHANFISQHHSSELPCYSLFKLPIKSSSGVLQGTIEQSLRY